jgi:hypothetical protein
VQEAVADLLSETAAAVASSFYVAHLVDRMDTGMATEDERGTYRLFVNVNKYVTSVRGSEMVHRAIEVLGGNGAIESFSILPRLYRDMVVLESWEGTHNVLCLQVLRDIARYGIHEPFLRQMNDHLESIARPELAEHVQSVQNALNELPALLGRLNAGGEAYAQAHARRLADKLAFVAQSALLLSEAEWELNEGLTTSKPDLAAYFINCHLTPGYDPTQDESYLARLKRLMTAL